MPDLRVDPSRAALLIVDVQERLWAAMAAADRAAADRNIAILLEMARRLGMPVVQSEQYPRGLGPTVPALAAALAAPGLEVHRMEKIEFSCADAPAFADIWAKLGREQWVVAGMEAHVCVYQTVRGLVGRGATVHVPADAVISRTAENKHVGLGLIEKVGGVVTSTETVVFDALGKAGSDDFRALSKLIR